MNQFAYVNGDPINFVDLNGKNGIAVDGLIVGGVILTIGFVIVSSDPALERTLTKWIDSKLPNLNWALNEAVPELPTGIVGDNPGGNKNRTNTDKPAEDFEEVIKDLTGGVLEEQGGHQVCPNGVRIRRGKEGEGPRIDIPPNGSKPQETIHFPPRTKWPF